MKKVGLRSDSHIAKLGLMSLIIFLDVRAGICELTSNGKSHIETLLEASQTANSDQEGKQIELMSAHPESDADIDALVETLNGPNTTLHKAAEAALSNVSATDVQFKGKYSTLLSHPSESVQVAAIQACAKLKAIETAPKILEMLRNRKRYRINKNVQLPFDPEGFELHYADKAMHALIDLGYEPAIDEIVSRDELMAGDNGGVALTNGFGAKAVQKLIPIVRDENDIRRSAAEQGIIYNTDPNAVPILIPLLKDPKLRLTAIYSLGRLAGTSSYARQALVQEYQTMSMSDKALTLTNVAGSETASKKAGTGSGLSVDTLMRIQDLLAESIKSNDGLSELRMIDALSGSRDPKAVPILEKYLKDPNLAKRDWSLDLRTEAAWGLWKITGKRYSFPLKEREKELAERRWQEHVLRDHSSAH